jgi:hypothetical protein
MFITSRMKEQGRGVEAAGTAAKMQGEERRNDALGMVEFSIVQKRS